MKTLRHILAVSVLLLTLFSCSQKKERVIPKDSLSEIYAEMFVMDQWLDDNRDLRRTADTSLVYAPVLEKYGYTYDDYLRSVDVYMKDPQRYAKILRGTSEILNARLSELKAEKKAMEDAEREKARRDSLLNTVRINVDSLMRLMSRRDPCDSLTVGWDSLGGLEWRFVQTSDTTFDGPAMVFRIDSLKTAVDSLSVEVDSLSPVSASEKNVIVKDEAVSEPKPLNVREVVNSTPQKKELRDRQLGRKVLPNSGKALRGKLVPSHKEE